MRLRLSLVLLLTLHLAGAARAQSCDKTQLIQYEDAVTELTGRLKIGHARHPNGTMMRYPILQLSTPVSIQSDGKNSVNEAEACVSEIQLTDNNSELHKKLYAAQNKLVRVKGTVFHAHTAWHMRKLVMMVETAQSAR